MHPKSIYTSPLGLPKTHMGSTNPMSPILPIFLLLFLPPLPLCSSLSLAVTLSRDDLIQKTCYSTTFYDFCVSSLSSSPQLTPASNTTVKSLSAIIINLAISNATSTSTFASTLSKNTTTINPSLSSLLRMCAKKYTYAKEALQLSLVAMEDDEYDYALVHMSAAAEYPNACRRLFSGRGAGGGVVYPVEMGRREEVLERLCTVASDIISVLQG